MNSMIVLSLVSTCVFELSLAADEVILMDPFDPQQLEGIWHVYQRNQNLMNSSGGALCLKVIIEHDPSGSDVYKMNVKWKDVSNGNMDMTLYVVDDKAHPAQYFFKNNDHRIALSVLGTDYKNWIVAHGMLGLRDSYFVALRKMPVQDSYLTEARKILETNKVTKPFVVLDHSSC